ncbi:YlcG family protein [Pluralibacter gergoviae]|uniref:YlcG family protein n=1 Tax=Pluralibacter gergoviae TaxID=61647 RepID=A0AAI9DND5_PLUGE|nr:YlcG family protein [Pluralibacter gergoviae]EKV9911269.1 YlcG family protein [Pluralibacter gergoviae]EKW7277229.1 YlcG family protein [Pluralibacter gergoviae]ELD4298721.1 YlcG family protein [Pluralibacter gergoviae]ELD4309501.1 YlcG family protein [Pluralibacter gergoviae]
MKTYDITPELIRQRWQFLRCYRCRGSFQPAYHIIRNYVRIQQITGV